MSGDLRSLAIRGATSGDATRVAEVYIDSWNAGFGELMPTRVLDQQRIDRWRADLTAGAPHHWWVAVRAGSVVGFAGVGPSRDPIAPGLGELDTIAISPPHWRSGVGRALMGQALVQFLADGYREAILWTLANYPRGAHFYVSTGWRPNGRTRASGTQVCFARRLDSV